MPHESSNRSDLALDNLWDQVISIRLRQKALSNGQDDLDDRSNDQIREDYQAALEEAAEAVREYRRDVPLSPMDLMIDFESDYLRYRNIDLQAILRSWT